MRISLIWGPKRFLLSPWVETSCRNFLPSLLPLVSTLPVIYARSIFEQQGPWLIKTLFSRSLLTTVCSLAAGVDVARSPSRREPMAHKRILSAQLSQGFVASESPGDAWHVCSQRPARPQAPVLSYACHFFTLQEPAG